MVQETTKEGSPIQIQCQKDWAPYVKISRDQETEVDIYKCPICDSLIGVVPVTLQPVSEAQNEISDTQPQDQQQTEQQQPILENQPEEQSEVLPKSKARSKP